MNSPQPRSFPSAAVKVRLLQDAVYSENMDLWATLLRYQTHIENYFQEIGLQLVIHEEDGFAYLKQADQEESTPIPRLFRRDKLSKGVAIVGVVLRERLLQFDEKIHDESRLIVKKSDIIQMTTPFFPETNDEIRADRKIETAISKAEEMGLLRKLADGEGEDRYEVRRIIKSRFLVDTLKSIREQLEIHANTRDSQ
jgi:hypothetical protein